MSLSFGSYKFIFSLKVFSYSFQTLAEQVTDKELAEGRLYPPLSNIREVSVQMAVKASLLEMTISLADKTKAPTLPE